MVGETSAAVLAVREMEEKRKARREAAANEKKRQEEEELKYGSNPNWKIQKLVDDARENLPPDEVSPIASELETESLWRSHPAYNGDKILVCVRTRPLSKKETGGGDFRILSFRNKQNCIVHDVKKTVDNSLKLENQDWKFDFAFDERNPNNEVYRFTLLPLIDSLFSKGSKISMFAYGQTGAGKSYTMMSIFEQSVNDMFVAMHSDELFAHLSLHMSVSFYEVYQGKVFDLFANRNPLDVLEDGDGAIHLRGLSELPANTPDQVLSLLEIGQKVRATRATEMNDTSSRSHAILQVILKNPDDTNHAQLTLIDLAGSEKGSDTPYSDKQTRNEAAEINKSLLSLKECIRALDMGSSHAPFRGSKLTMIIRDALIDPKSLSIMVACVGPAFSACEATMNTLRYAERLKTATGGPEDSVDPNADTDAFDAIPISNARGLSDDEKTEVVARLRLLERLREEAPKFVPPPKSDVPDDDDDDDVVMPLVAQPTPSNNNDKQNASRGRTASMGPSTKPSTKPQAPPPANARKGSAPSAPSNVPQNLGGMADMIKKKPAPAAPAAASKPSAPPAKTATAPPSKPVAAPSKPSTGIKAPAPAKSNLPAAQQPAMIRSASATHSVATVSQSVANMPSSGSALIGLDVSEYLKSLGVAMEDADSYAKALKDQGFDDADSLRDLKEEEMVNEFGMKKGHARKIVRWLNGDL
eukprot:c11919_g1_i2.p1 GENE.c11919_g1_i2~~c11919_g1_i2.p1  ORF type:complete len:700 (+),score=166.28 c11919_g1_i2:200-2299(+)